MKTARNIILGGGIAGVSLASFVEDRSVVLERQETFGGLSKSYSLNGISYDFGPHIIFSKNQEVLNLHTSIVSTNKIRRSNQIFFKGRYVKYPFENDLYALDPDDREYCLKEFLDNPYEHYAAGNMLQFFLKLFGEGITRTYLQPYNEKIWKFDPACLDLQMVERIPKPPREDVINSAKGIPTEGYTHQLHFHYPAHGGFQSLVDSYVNMARSIGHELTNGAQVISIGGSAGNWSVETTAGRFSGEQLINTMPIHELFTYLHPPENVRNALNRMLYNSMYVILVQVKRDKIGDHFALYIPEKEIIFHRLSKLNFLGDAYCLPNGGSSLMAEVTFRPGSYLGSVNQQDIADRVVSDLCKLGFIERNDLIDVEIRSEKYAYVIYDLHHRKNTDIVLSYLASRNIFSVGRFAEFEYVNTDAVVERTIKLSKTLNRATKPTKV